MLPLRAFRRGHSLQRLVAQGSRAKALYCGVGARQITARIHWQANLAIPLANIAKATTVLLKKLHRSKMTPNSSVFGHCVNFGLIRFNVFRLRRHSGIRRGPRTEHVRGLLQQRSILNSLCWRILHCVSNQPVHIWLPRSAARKNNHGLTRNPREPSDWQAVEGKQP